MAAFVGAGAVRLGGKAAGGYCGLHRKSDGLGVSQRMAVAAPVNQGAAGVQMKIFDWKRRGEDGSSMWTLHIFRCFRDILLGLFYHALPLMPLLHC